MSVPKEARILYVAAEIYLLFLDRQQKAPDYLSAEARKGWDRAIAHVRASCAESQLRVAAHNMLPMLYRDPDYQAELRRDFACATSSPSPTVAVAGSSDAGVGLDGCPTKPASTVTRSSNTPANGTGVSS